MTGSPDDRREPGRLVEQGVKEGGIDTAARWLGIHQRYAIDDSERMYRIEERLERLERGGVIRRFLRWWL